MAIKRRCSRMQFPALGLDAQMLTVVWGERAWWGPLSLPGVCAAPISVLQNNAKRNFHVLLFFIQAKVFGEFLSVSKNKQQCRSLGKATWHM